MDLPLSKKKKLSSKEKTELKKTSYYRDLNIYKILKQSLLRECDEEINKNVSDKKPYSPFLKNMSIGRITLCEDTTNLIENKSFREKIERVMEVMDLLSENPDDAEYIIDVDIMHCMNIDILIKEDSYLKHLIRTNLNIKYSTIKKSSGAVVCELWYQGRGEKKVKDVDDNVKKETLEMAYDDNFNYILDMMRTNKF